jgi:hypothetical protein
MQISLPEDMTSSEIQELPEITAVAGVNIRSSKSAKTTSGLKPYPELNPNPGPS